MISIYKGNNHYMHDYVHNNNKNKVVKRSRKKREGGRKIKGKKGKKLEKKRGQKKDIKRSTPLTTSGSVLSIISIMIHRPPNKANRNN